MLEETGSDQSVCNILSGYNIQIIAYVVNSDITEYYIISVFHSDAAI